MKKNAPKTLHDVKVVQSYSTLRARCMTDGCKWKGPNYSTPSLHAYRFAQRDAAEHRARANRLDLNEIPQPGPIAPKNAVVRWGFHSFTTERI